jgi:hypothetical protein
LIAREYGESYSRIFEAAFNAGIEAAAQFSDAEIERLSRYTGIVGMVAQHVKETRARARKTPR